MCTDRMHFQKGSSHKTDLCQYQYLDLCQQWNTIKSSYQESENKRKNKKRLQSSTMQKFSTHFIYNMLMDFYQNEEIVHKQKKSLLGILKGGLQYCAGYDACGDTLSTVGDVQYHEGIS